MGKDCRARPTVTRFASQRHLAPIAGRPPAGPTAAARRSSTRCRYCVQSDRCASSSAPSEMPPAGRSAAGRSAGRRAGRRMSPYRPCRRRRRHRRRQLTMLAPVAIDACGRPAICKGRGHAHRQARKTARLAALKPQRRGIHVAILHRRDLIDRRLPGSRDPVEPSETTSSGSPSRRAGPDSVAVSVTAAFDRADAGHQGPDAGAQMRPVFRPDRHDEIGTRRPPRIFSSMCRPYRYARQSRAGSAIRAGASPGYQPRRAALPVHRPARRPHRRTAAYGVAIGAGTDRQS